MTQKSIYFSTRKSGLLGLFQNFYQSFGGRSASLAHQKSKLCVLPALSYQYKDLRDSLQKLGYWLNKRRKQTVVQNKYVNYLPSSAFCLSFLIQLTDVSN